MIRILVAALFCACMVAPAKAETRFIPHPAGCPRVAFCGCGASVEVFGKPIRSLYLSTAWFRFPRSDPSAGKVAVRRGHVFVLREHVAGKVWRVYDANSGGGKTRIHNRSISGWTIVNPHGGSSQIAHAF